MQRWSGCHNTEIEILYLAWSYAGNLGLPIVPQHKLKHDCLTSSWGPVPRSWLQMHRNSVLLWLLWLLFPCTPPVLYQAALLTGLFLKIQTVPWAVGLRSNMKITDFWLVMFNLSNLFKNSLKWNALISSVSRFFFNICRSCWLWLMVNTVCTEIEKGLF